MKKARVVRWESLEVYCVGRWVLRQRSQYLMCLALLNVGRGSEDMVLLAFCFLPRRRDGLALVILRCGVTSLS